MTTTSQARRDIAAYLQTLNGARTRSGNYLVPCASGQLQVELHVRGSITTWIGLDRYRARDATGHTVDWWLQANVWPYMNRWSGHTRRGNSLPTGGSYSSGTVLTSEAVDLLQAWLPQELAWQEAMTEPTDLGDYRRRRQAAS